MYRKTYYEFWPFNRDLYTTHIIESPKLDRLSNTRRTGVLRDLLNDKGVYYGDYTQFVEHPTLESASARERGCKFTLSNDKFEYTEESGDEYMSYFSLSQYTKNSKAYSNYDGPLDAKMMVISYDETVTYLTKAKIDFSSKIAAICPPGFDGCVCRECRGPKYMAEPDGLINDGMLTCFLCTERRKSFRQWPYSKEEIELKEKEALKNG